ncbi:MAG: shikimate dehydrogenase [Casimicrobiaceae bacterium]
MTRPVLNGETRVIAIVGDPIAQVKSPAGVTAALQAQGRNCIVVPIHVTVADLDEFIRGASRARNFDGIIVTVPHKFAAYGHCATATERAHFLGAVNTLRRNADGGWHGDQVDGEGFVAGIRTASCRPEGQRALVAGAGGAGSAIALALLDAGVEHLAIHDGDAGRRDALLGRLAARYGAKVSAGSADPAGYTLLVNATPAGMRAGDPLPLQAERLTREMFVGDVITAPAVTPLLEAARQIGCATQTGGGMFAAVSALMVCFLLEAGPLAR